MQIKRRRDFTLVEILEDTLKMIPLARRLKASIEFATSEKILSQNLEIIYSLAAQRMLHLSYYIEWARTIQNGKDLKPGPHEKNLDYVIPSFHDFSDIPVKDSSFLNASLAEWVNNMAFRDLSEFLKIFLLEIYEVCVTIDRTKKPIRPSDIVDIKVASRHFENGGLKERLSELRNKFGFKLHHNKEILALYEVRNLFAHFDGIVTKEICGKKGYLEISWPQNSVKFKKRGKDEWVPYHKIHKPFSFNHYDCAKITWLSKPKVLRYEPQERISLSYRDLGELVFFYLYNFNILHERLVSYAKEQELKVKPFDVYRIVPDGIWLTSSDEV